MLEQVPNFSDIHDDTTLNSIFGPFIAFYPNFRVVLHFGIRLKKSKIGTRIVQPVRRNAGTHQNTGTHGRV